MGRYVSGSHRADCIPVSSIRELGGGGNAPSRAACCIVDVDDL
jgi:hypothetical protein